MRVRRFDRGATSVEYALLAGFIAVVVALTIAGLGVIVHGFFGSGVDAVQSPAPTAPGAAHVQAEEVSAARGWSAPHHATATLHR